MQDLLIVKPIAVIAVVAQQDIVWRWSLVIPNYMILLVSCELSTFTGKSLTPFCLYAEENPQPSAQYLQELHNKNPPFQVVEMV